MTNYFYPEKFIREIGRRMVRREMERLMEKEEKAKEDKEGSEPQLGRKSSGNAQEEG